ncbi:MAG: MBL fold metallo-hydrolase [Anaeromyxobacter sp.]|nr:MBL fold metallo-hydrolase [Anaeromyxobacter sp.]
MTEPDLAGLGVHRIAIPIPFAAAGGPVNLYVIEQADGGLTLFDAGLGSDEAQAALLAGFARLGFSLSQVRRIVVSHGHVDHFGAARFVAEQAGRAVEVLAHPADAPKLDEAGPAFAALMPAFDAHFERLGVPAEVRLVMRQAGERSHGLSRRVPDVQPIGEGDVVEGRAVRFEVRHFPGHTPGLVALHEPRLGLLLPADHLLERISPNPLIELGPDGQDGFFRPLLAYLASLARTRALELALVLPGHGPPFSGHRRVIDGLTGFYLKRQARLAGFLAGGPRTGWQLTSALFPLSRPHEAFLTVSEAVANLEVMQARGEVARQLVGGGFEYRLAG